MKLHIRIIILLTITISILFIAGQFMMYFRISTLVQKNSNIELERLTKNFELSAKNICLSISRSVAGSLERGEMEKFQKLLYAQQDIKGLVEFSLFDQSGIAAYSSVNTSIEKEISMDIISQLQETKDYLLLWQENVIEIYQPLIINQDCIRCHVNWNLNEIGGIEYFAFATKSLTDAKNDNKIMINKMKRSLLISLILFVILIIIVIVITCNFLIRRFVTNPLNKFIKYLKLVSSGDLSQKLQETSYVEIGEMEKALNNMVHAFNSIIYAIKSGISNLTIQPDQMVKIFESLRNISDNILHQTNNLVSSSKHLNINLNSISDSSQDMNLSLNNILHNIEKLSNNINSVAGSTEQMQNSMKSVDKAAYNGKTIIVNVISMAKNASDIITSLNNSAKEINDVTYIIRRIAYKTNIIALNASIEAASAGEAGKSFAVLASDIQLFADQSRKAANTIKKRIHIVQKGTEEAVNAINKVLDTINKMNESVLSISFSVEEQTIAAGEIAQNVFESDKLAKNISQSMKDFAQKSDSILKNVFEASDENNELTNSIHGLKQTSENSNSLVKTIQNITSDLDQLTEELQQQIITFKT